MKKKLLLLITACLACLCLEGCMRSGDYIDIYNKSDFIYDNIKIEVKSGYYYKNHKMFAVDGNTIGLTIYFTNDEEWG